MSRATQIISCSAPRSKNCWPRNDVAETTEVNR
jgi:hypothetical protein